MASFAFMLLCVYLTTHLWYFPWYFPPVGLFGTLAIVRGLVHIGDGLARMFPADWVYAGGRLLAGFLLLLLLVRHVGLLWATSRQMTIQDRVIEMGHRRQIGEWLRDHLQPHESVYLEPFGYIGYFSGARIVDWPGLVAPEVVRLRRQEQATMVQAAERLQPDWMVLRPSEIAEMSEASFFQNYALVKVFNANPGLKKYERIPGPSWLKFDSQLSVFRRLPNAAGSPALREAPLNVEPTRRDPPESHPTLIYVLPRPQRALAVRLTLVFENPVGTAPFHFSWRGIPQGDDGGERSLQWPQIRGPGAQTRLIWLDDTIEVMRISPDDQPPGFRMKSIVFLETDHPTKR
jgi:hypothetical protein